jgi:hypothetical protein
MNKTKELTLIAILSVTIFISGMFKLPSFIPGAEFQLSAPIAIMICACFGFKRYFVSGILASVISFFLGTQSLISITVAMVFRIVVGGMIAVFGTGVLIILICGPIGSIAARAVLSVILHTSFPALVLPAIPGMLFTMVTANVFYRAVYTIVQKTEFSHFLTLSRKSPLLKGVKKGICKNGTIQY